MAVYCGQRAWAGLLITEGVAPSPNDAGYARIPGIYNQNPINAWKLVAERIRKDDAKFFMHIMHTGRVSHPGNLPTGAEVLAPSAMGLTETKMWTDHARQPEPMPVA